MGGFNMEVIDPKKFTSQKVVKEKEALIYDVKMTEDLVVAISQYRTVEYTLKALVVLKDEGIPFTSLVLFDGSRSINVAGTCVIYPEVLFDFHELYNIANLFIDIRQPIHSLPHIWNLMFGAAKLTRAKYMFWQGSDMEIKPGALKSMMGLIEKYDIVNPIKIDNDMEKFKNYTPIYDKPQLIAGINDSAALFRLDKLPFFPFDYEYAPYQFETSALGYKLWRMGLTSVLDPNAVIFHHVSKDIENCSKEREIGSSTWDKKRDIFLKKDPEKPGWVDNEKKFFLEKSIMNSEVANKIGFPVHIYGDTT